MQGYRPESYGDRIADVYDEWYRDVSDVDATVRFVDEVARAATGGQPTRVLELAAGTGRLAIPLARLGHDVTALDISAEMLGRLRSADRDVRVTTLVGDMVDDIPEGPFDVVFVAFNSLFMLTEPERQAACFATVGRRLTSSGVFVVEAFVPYDPPKSGVRYELRVMTADRVVFAVNDTDPATQRVFVQYVELADGQPVRLRPCVLRYSTPAELDRFAARAGMRLAERYENFGRDPFTEESGFHVSVYRDSNG